MKTTEEYLWELVQEMSQKVEGKSQYETLKIITELCEKYATLIDAIKLTKRE